MATVIQYLTEIWNFLISDGGYKIWLVLFGISELLAQIPFIKANSVFQSIVNGLSWIKAKLWPNK